MADAPAAAEETPAAPEAPAAEPASPEEPVADTPAPAEAAPAAETPADGAPSAGPADGAPSAAPDATGDAAPEAIPPEAEAAPAAEPEGDEDGMYDEAGEPGDDVDDDEREGFGDDDDGAYGDFDLAMDGGEAEAEEDKLAEEEERANLAELYHSAHEERERYLELNQMLQKKLAEYLRTVKKSEENKESEKSVTDQEQRYIKCLAQVNELRDELKKVQAQYDRMAMEMKNRLDDKEEKAREIKDAFMEFKREIMKGAENSRTGKPIPTKLIKAFEENERQKDSEVEKMRLTNINRRNILRKLEQTLRQKEKLADGLHLIDFEQLKIENQTLNEKIEERNEELLKLRKKTTTTVQVLTHLKEKLQFVQAENQVLKHDLADLEIELTNKRDVLTRIKHERDALRAENTSRRQQRGLVSSEDLLLDFEKRKHEMTEKKDRLEHLMKKHAELTAQITMAKREIANSGGLAL